MKRAESGIVALGVLITLGTTHQASASGFSLRENSSVMGGEADAGIASSADDLSTITTNPAGMTYFDGAQVSAGSYYINPTGKMHVTGAGTNATGLPPLPEHGGDGQEPTVSKVVPSAYLLWAPTDALRLGIGVSVPFGLVTNYSSDSLERYQALYSSVEATDINPSIAYRVTPWLSLGAGVSIQQVNVHLTNAIDFGTLVPLTLLQHGALSPAAAVAALTTGAGQMGNDGRADIKGSSWGTGFDLGAIVQPAEGTRLGLSYRSGIDHTVKGPATFAVPAQYQAILAGTGQFTSTSFSAPLSLPGNVTVGVTQQVNQALELSLTYQWTNWSKFKTLQVNFANANQAPIVNPQNYQDTSFFSAGGNYRLNDQLTLRGGVAYDETPTTDASRNYLVPDASRYWISTGASYQLTSGITLTVSYQHLFFDTSAVNHTQTITPGLTNTVVGSGTISAELLAVEIAARF